MPQWPRTPGSIWRSLSSSCELLKSVAPRPRVSAARDHVVNVTQPLTTNHQLVPAGNRAPLRVVRLFLEIAAGDERLRQVRRILDGRRHHEPVASVGVREARE